MAEATGVFFYVFPGIASVANLLVNAENPLGAPVFSSFLQIAISFSLGITYAIVVVCSIAYIIIDGSDIAVRSDERRTLQPSHHDMFCSLAGLPLEESALLYRFTNFWGVPCGSVCHGHVLATDSGAECCD